MKYGTLVAVLSGITFFAASDIYLTVSRDEAPSAKAPSSAPVLDPRKLALNLCSRDADKRGLFFRPEFRMSLVGGAAAQPAATDDPPLWDGLGDYTYPITTQSEEAQAYFNQGLRLAYGFNHGEAARAFRKAQALDPMCALCYWGEALVLGPNINAPMEPDAVAPAFAAVARAEALADGAGEKEQGLIRALAERYSPDPEADRAALDAAYADAMEALYRQYPDDAEIATLYAESVMDLSPWNYWERDFTTPRGRAGDAISAVEAVLDQNPEHPGAIHLYIHLMEASAMPEKAEVPAERLGDLMPAAGHIVHMPSHIYFRVGRYLDSLEANVAAVKADEAYLAEAEPSDIYRFGYYPHNVHFVLVSAQMAGDGHTALDYAEKLDTLIPMEVLSAAALFAPIKAAPYFAVAQFGEVEDAMALPDPGDDPYIRAIWHYTRGAALAADGQGEAAMAEADAIAALNTPESLAFYTEGGVPADEVLYIAETMVRARVLQAAGEYERAIPLFEQAAELQDNILYAEPPYWYYPIKQSLGALYLQAGRPDDAVKAFTSSLLQHPNNAWSLYGLMTAQEAAGDTAGAAYTKGLLEDAAVNPEEEIPLERL